jgi:hypothetical protein
MNAAGAHKGRAGRLFLFVPIPIIALALGACSPTITSVGPRPAFVGDVVTIEGQFFGPAQGSSTVTFSGVDAGAALSWSDTSIQVRIPSGAYSGPVVVTVGGRPSNPWDFIVSELVVQGCSSASLAMDPEGEPHVSCFDTAQKDLVYLSRSAGQWVAEIVDAEGDKGRYSSVAVDPAGVPHISYFDGSTLSLTYATKDELGWHTEIVDHGYNDGFMSWVAGFDTSIGLDSAGLPRIAYMGQASSSPSPGSNWLVLKYAWRDEAGVWSTEEVYSSLGYDVNSLGVSMRIGDDDVPRIAHGRDWILSPGTLFYSSKTGSSWTTEEVVEWTIYDSPGHHPSLALDSSRSPRISHYDSYGRNLEYAYWNAGSWTNEVVDSGRDVGRSSSLGIVSSGRPVILYYDAQDGDLRRAAKNAQGAWQIDLFATEGDVGSSVRMVLDAQDRIHAIYDSPAGLVYDSP